MSLRVALNHKVHQSRFFSRQVLNVYDASTSVAQAVEDESGIVARSGSGATPSCTGPLPPAEWGFGWRLKMRPNALPRFRRLSAVASQWTPGNHGCNAQQGQNQCFGRSHRSVTLSCCEFCNQQLMTASSLESLKEFKEQIVKIEVW